jgi:hypothetical protein
MLFLSSVSIWGLPGGRKTYLSKRTASVTPVFQTVAPAKLPRPPIVGAAESGAFGS